MKRLVLLMLVALPFAVSAQKIGYVNSQELFALMPEVKTAQARIDSLSTQYETMFANMQEEYKKKLAEYEQKSATMTDAMKQIQEEELYGLQQRIQTAYQTAQQDIQTKQQEFLVPIREKMMKAIKNVGDKNGYTYIFTSGAALYEGGDDVLPLVKKEMGLK